MHHQVPKEFKHYVAVCIGDNNQSQLAVDLCTFFPQKEGNSLFRMASNGNGYQFYTHPLSSPVKYGEVDAYVHNQEKQGYLYVWFKTREDFFSIVDYINKKKAKEVKEIKHQLYRMDIYGNWRLSEQYQSKQLQNFVGYHHYLDKIAKDIANYAEQREYLRELGESKSLNYLLYGPPGVGKTSLIMTLSSMYNYPLYIVNSTCRSINGLTIKDGNNDAKVKILLFEDFDRFLEHDDRKSKVDEKSVQMSDILNSLDGANSGEGVIRFFTGNDCKTIFSNKALVNRMSACFKFSMPTREMYDAKLKSLLRNRTLSIDDDEKCDQLIDHAVDKVTLRPFVNYVIRYLFDENYLDNMLENIDELVGSNPEEDENVKEIQREC